MSSPPHFQDAAALSRPLSLSSHTSSLDTGSTASQAPLSLLSSAPNYFPPSCTASEAPTNTTTKTMAPPPPPVARMANLPLRHTHSLHSLLSTYRAPFTFTARQLTASEAASEMISRGSYGKREDETRVEALLLDTTQPFCLPPAVTTPTASIHASDASDTDGEEEEEEQGETELLAATLTVGSSKGGSNSSRVSAPYQRAQAHRMTLLSHHLEASTRIEDSETVEVMETYDPHLRKIVSYELMSSPSLRSPNTTTAGATPQQHLVSNSLYPITPPQSQCPSRPPPWTPSGSLLGTSVTAPISFVVDAEEPRGLMRFPAFEGFTDTLQSHSTRSTRGSGNGGNGGSGRSASKSKGDLSFREAPVGPSTLPSKHAVQMRAAEESSREKRTAPGLGPADYAFSASEGISGVFPALSPITPTSVAPAAALLSSHEVVAPCRSLSLSPADSRASTHRQRSTSHRQLQGTAANISEILTSPNFQPVSVNHAAAAQSLPSVQLSCPVPRHLHRISLDGRPSLEPLPFSNDVLSNSVPNLSTDPPRATAHARSIGHALPPLSPQVSNSNVHESKAPSPARAASYTVVDAAGPRTPLLGRLFREPKGYKSRVWVSTATSDDASLLSSEKRGGHCD